MSLFIKGMEIPKDGCLHMICIDADGTVSMDGRVYTAVPVPPHGRLVDADALKNSFYRTFDAILETEFNYLAKGLLFSAHILDDAPTVIPAERSEECPKQENTTP